MWVFNITREINKISDFTVLPIEIPHDDEKTGFQTNHISNWKSGEWQKNFSNDEIKVINGEFSQFLKEYGYD